MTRKQKIFVEEILKGENGINIPLEQLNRIQNATNTPSNPNNIWWFIGGAIILILIVLKLRK